jgi:hypothetical protein
VKHFIKTKKSLKEQLGATGVELVSKGGYPQLIYVVNGVVFKQPGFPKTSPRNEAAVIRSVLDTHKRMVEVGTNVMPYGKATIIHERT